MMMEESISELEPIFGGRGIAFKLGENENLHKKVSPPFEANLYTHLLIDEKIGLSMKWINMNNPG